MKYHQLTDFERYTISTLRKEGYSMRAVARALARSPSTISREIDRNASDYDGAYRPSRACEKARGRRRRSRRGSHITRHDWLCIEALIRADWSPEQIAGRLERFHNFSISHETIYRYIWADKANGGNLWRHLRGARKKRRKRYASHDSRGRLAGKRHITERPDAAENRTRLGHWEIDTVHGHGSKDSVVTLVDRKSRYTLIGKLPNLTSDSLNDRTTYLVYTNPLPFKTVTADNGSEFHGYKVLEDKTDVQCYFATPYHSWERGTNENTNGLIRQYLPKRTSMESVNQSDCEVIARKLNTRPRKCLGFRTPHEVMYANRKVLHL